MYPHTQLDVMCLAGLLDELELPERADIKFHPFHN